MAKLKEIVVGQKVYITRFSGFIKTEPNIREEEVVRVNKSSFYTVDKNGKYPDFETRFKRSTWEMVGRMDYGRAYETEEEYWKLIAFNKEKREKKMKAKVLIDDASMAQVNRVLAVFE